jgi:hypothetical protein
VGRNCPAKAMPFDGMVRQYLIINTVNLLLLTNGCQQRSSTDYALGVAHITGRTQATIANFSCSLRLRFSSTRHVLGRRVRQAYFQCTLRSVWPKLLLDESCKSSSYVLLCHAHYLSERGMLYGTVLKSHISYFGKFSRYMNSYYVSVPTTYSHF